MHNEVVIAFCEKIEQLREVEHKITIHRGLAGLSASWSREAPWVRPCIRPTAADTDVLPFRQILSSIENIQSTPASGTSSIQTKATLGVENARLVPTSASLFMDIPKAFGWIWG